MSKTIRTLIGAGRLMFFIIGWVLWSQEASSQSALPVIRSATSIIDVTVDGAFINGKWKLEPGQKPDVFIPAVYSSKSKVAFYTDVDSVSFTVKPEEKIDFMILLNNKDSCFIQIAPLHTPFFLRESVAGSSIVLLFVLVLAAYTFRRLLHTYYLLRVGYCVPVLFWSSTFIAGVVQRGYRHKAMPVSQLGAIGTESEWFMAIMTAVSSVLVIPFFIGLYRACRQMKAPALPVFSVLVMCLSLGWAAVFPLRHPLHAALGPIFLMVGVGQILAFLLWKNISQLRLTALLSAACFLVFASGLLRFIPSLNNQFPGWIQRLFHLGWSLWFVALSFGFGQAWKSKGIKEHRALLYS